MAGAPAALLTIDQVDPTTGATTATWTENLVQNGLLNFNAQTGNFAMTQGTAGQTITTDNVDYWAWQTSDNSWLWHSAQTVSGQTLTIDQQKVYNNPSDPWAAVAKLTSVSGHGDPDLAYGYFAKNNTASTQTYTFTLGESIAPPVGTPAQVYADIGYSLTNSSGHLSIAPVAGNTAMQSFLLSIGGGPLINAGVDVGPGIATSALGTSLQGPCQSLTVAAPTGTWDYMQITTKFTLSPNKDVASISGYASITPVPEPGTYAMLLAGLGMIGATLRRRSTRR
jgi:hypothetical protein